MDLEPRLKINEQIRDYSLMTTNNCHIKVYGKCILSGEHAVLRGHPALVVPLKTKSLELIYRPTGSDKALKIESVDLVSEPTKMVLWGVIEKALGKVNKEFSDLPGLLRVKNEIPFGAGLGASAALCVSVARLFEKQNWLAQAEIFEFARDLENIFHGESSGVDVAVAQHEKPIRYLRGKGVESLNVVWWPKLFLSHSGTKGVTAECVKKVQELHKTSPLLAIELDNKMAESVKLLEQALTEPMKNDKESEDNWRNQNVQKSFDLALDCYVQWGLTKGVLNEHLKLLGEYGVKAMKPTGSGMGGHVLSVAEVAPVIDGVVFTGL